MFKVDLHTHSVASPDGGITAAQYQKVLETGVLDVVAITDHNCTDFALTLHEKLGNRIIVGEEIMTSEGEIIGLFLTEAIQPHLSPHETIARIKQQGGVVYVPHPFETIRKGLHPAILEGLLEDIDLIEVSNGRAFMQNYSQQAAIWAKLNRVCGMASSDAHGIKGLGQTYTSLAQLPTKSTLLTLCASGTPMVSIPGMRALLYPKYHRLKKKIRGNT